MIRTVSLHSVEPMVEFIVRLMLVSVVALTLALRTLSAYGQDWSQYLAFDDFFSIDFPAEPTIRESSYTTSLGIMLPTRVFTAEDDFGHYSVTVVNWRNSEPLYDALLAGCQDCDGAMTNDIRGAAVHATFGLLKRGGEVTHLARSTVEGVRGVRVHLLNEDGSRTAAVSHWHEYRLYIVEATAPSGMPPGLFVDSIGFVDEAGRRVQYRGRYAPLFPKPSRSR